MIPRSRIRPWVWAALVVAPAIASGSVLSVDEVSGAGSLLREQAEAPLQAGTELREGDSLRVSDGGRLRLNIARHGFLELGPQAELVLERLPSVSYAEDLRTSLRLTRGTLRVVWRYPGADVSWPLFVYFGNLRASLRSGEYFVQAAAEGPLPLCVVSGEAAVSVPGVTRPQLLAGPACFPLRASESAPRLQRSESDFISARAELSLAALLEPAPPAPRPAASISAPPPVAEAAPVPAERKGWVVNIASSASREAAEKDANKLRAAGVPVAVSAVEIGGRTWYRVQVVGVPDLAAAQALAARVKTEFGYAQPWLQRP